MPTPVSLSLGYLNGRNAFRLQGTEADAAIGDVIGAGDVNGDGFDDVIVTGTGLHYVVLGSDAGFSGSLTPDQLDGSNGFQVVGDKPWPPQWRLLSSGGDLNGDGFDDLIVSLSERRDGEYVSEIKFILGTDAGFPAVVPVAEYSLSGGVFLYEDDDRLDISPAGDVNGDGLDDVIIGSFSGGYFGGFQGAAYVVFGSETLGEAPMSFQDFDGTNGIAIYGVEQEFATGLSVSGAGDVNGDGLDDFVIGAPGAGFFATTVEGASRVYFEDAGTSYVIFGSDTGFPGEVHLHDLDTSMGFRFIVPVQGANSGRSVSSAGDVNGDGIDDIIIGAPYTHPAGLNRAGESYVVFGSSSGFPLELSSLDLDGTNGFAVQGSAQRSLTGAGVSSAGDVNGDGFDDLMIGAPNSSFDKFGSEGAAYVVFGTDAGFPARFSTSTLDGTNGFRIEGVDRDDRLGSDLSAAGDVNGDGFDDMLLGVRFTDPDGVVNAGMAYVVFGSETGFSLEGLVGVSGTDNDDWMSLPNDWRDGLVWIDGGAGSDMMSFDGVDAGVYVNLATGRAQTGFASARFTLEMQRVEHATGTSHGDIFNGSDRAETFRGLGGMDTFYASHVGADSYEGGAGADLVTYQQSGEGVAASLLRGRGWSGDAMGDRFANIENLTGSHHDDFLWGDHGNNRIEGLHGDDVIIGNGGDDYILAGHGTDTIVFSGNQADYTVTRNSIRTEVIDSVAGRDGHDVIGHAEILRFADGDLLL